MLFACGRNTRPLPASFAAFSFFLFGDRQPFSRFAGGRHRSQRRPTESTGYLSRRQCRPDAAEPQSFPLWNFPPQHAGASVEDGSVFAGDERSLLPRKCANLRRTISTASAAPGNGAKEQAEQGGENERFQRGGKTPCCTPTFFVERVLLFLAHCRRCSPKPPRPSSVCRPDGPYFFPSAMI